MSSVQTHALLVVHEKAGVQEIEAPGETTDDAVNSEVVMRAQDNLIEQYGEEPNCIVLPEDVPPNHPLVEAVDESMPELSLPGALRERGNEPV